MRVIIAAAGTGGHINPGIAIANKIKKEEPNSEIVFIGTNRGIENDLVPRAGYKLRTVEAYGLSKKISIETIKNNYKTLKGFKQAKKIVKEFNPDIVIGTGGYICGGVILSAHKLGIPTIIHESNAFPGKATKFLSKKLDRILVGFKETKNYLENMEKVVVTGTPTKVEKKNITIEEKEKLLKEINLSSKKPIVLVFGGSQGAQKINEALIELIKQKRNKTYQIFWATGPKQYEIVSEELKKNKYDINNLENTSIVPYIYNMSDYMNISDLVVCRSGAMTITELALVGKPAIFIPLPSMSANRQIDNAKVMEKIGAAKIILNNEINADNLSLMLYNMFKDTDKLKQMGQNASTIATYNVEDKIYKEIKNIVKYRHME
ncbi:MAG: undecaprenyldiphospho-muramoylpentapeptide beta-N-acetylglucosaminyltransferase [Clostridia bacterium]|nr:undecaprenyldiphospho-muramoylpentapeptide beta-N-acetylglucosaminyltransferase [Clostridia bacterium]